MSDLRQGVTEAGHAVLDALDLRGAAWRRSLTAAMQLDWAGMLALDAGAGHLPASAVRDMAIEAAARLIDAVGEIDRRIAAGEA